MLTEWYGATRILGGPLSLKTLVGDLNSQRSVQSERLLIMPNLQPYSVQSPYPLIQPPYVLDPCHFTSFMSGSSESRYIRLDVISGKNLKVPSWRIPAGINISISVDSQRRWKSAIVSYQLKNQQSGGEVIGKLQLSWHELLNHGEPFNLSFPSVRGVHPSLTLKVVVYACDDALSDTARLLETDAGHVRFSKYVKYKRVSHLKAAVQHFQLVLDQYPVNHPDHAAALANLAWARLKATPKMIFKTLMPPPPSSAKPLHCVRITKGIRDGRDGAAPSRLSLIPI
ncbi:hypothetical protein BDR05DRAFT_1003692 [Suillus weaverae]|nr:hypothetical protein BDR05DRAFT_1003692 [Suillus weaverae]